MQNAVFSGTFDPITLGHMDIIERSSVRFSEVIVAVMVDSSVITNMTSSVRIASVKAACSNLKNVRVMSFSGLLVDFLQYNNFNTLVRGLRCADDFQYEYRMSVMNQKMLASLETVFLMSTPDLAIISSTLVRQILKCGGDVSAFIAPEVEVYLEGVAWR